MNKKELLKQLEEAKNQIARLQSDIDKMQNAVDTIDGKDNSKPEFWFPENGEQYYFIDTSDRGYFCEPSSTVGDDDDRVDFINVMLNNAFRTEEECKTEIELLILFEEIKEKALQEDELVPKNKVLDTDTYKYIIQYNYSEHELCCCRLSIVYLQGIIPNCFFKTPEFTEKIIEDYGVRIKYLLNKKYRSE